MSSEEFAPIDPKHLEVLEARIRAGERARELWVQWGQWIEQTIFAPLNDEALVTLRNATSEDQRMRAQQMSLAVEKVRGIIEQLINQAEGAKAELKHISTLEGETK